MADHPFLQFVRSLDIWPVLGFGAWDPLVALVLAGGLLALVFEGWTAGHLGEDTMVPWSDGEGGCDSAE